MADATLSNESIPLQRTLDKPSSTRFEGLTLILLYLAIPSLIYSAFQHFLSWRKQNGGSKAKFPGPKQYPIVGRVHDLPRFSMWLKFKEWADIHGPIYQTHALNQTFIIISDEKIAEELLVKRGHIYSGRPQIRSLFRHKEGPAYVALMDRHGKSWMWMRCVGHEKEWTRLTRLTRLKTHG
jgi:hypothetical protein